MTVSQENYHVVIPKDRQRNGIYIDPDRPSWGWKDLIGQIVPKTTGAGTPTLSAFRGGNVAQFSFAANDVIDMNFHIPHDYAMGTDMFIHVHWGHNGTAISGSLVCDFYHTYQKGHNQGIFPVEKTTTLTVLSPDIATVPQYRHRVDEVQISSSTGSASLIDSDEFEPDGLLMLRMITSTIPTISGGSVARPFIFFVDLHYQTTSMPTKNKSPDFWR